VWIGKGEQGAAGARLAEALSTEARPIRDLLAQAPNLPAWCRLAYIYETYLAFSFAKAERTAAEAALPSDPDRALYQVAIPRIRQAPSDYARLSFHHLKCLLTLSLATDAERADFLRFVSAHRPLPFEEEVLDDGLKPLYSFPLIVRLGFQVTMAATAVLGVLGIVLVLWGRGAPLSLGLATLLGLVIHTNLMLVAMTAVGHPRYTLGVWIPLVVSMGLLAWFLWQQVAPHVPGGRTPLSTQRHRRGGQQVVAPE
jgi:hypothetical protein